MKESMNLLFSQEKNFINKKWRLKIKKNLTILILISIVICLSLMLMFMNFYCKKSIEKLDHQLNENQKNILENLDQKKSLVDSRKKLIDYLESKNIFAYHLMDNIQTSLTEEIKLLQIDYQDEKIIILGYSNNQDEIKAFRENLNKMDGLGEMKISHISNLNASENKEANDLIWEFSLEGKVKN